MAARYYRRLIEFWAARSSDNLYSATAFDVPLRYRKWELRPTSQMRTSPAAIAMTLANGPLATPTEALLYSRK